MPVGKILRESRALSIVVIMVCLGAAAAVAFLRGGDTSAPGVPRYFYNVHTKQIYVAPDAPPPIAVKVDGNTDAAGGVRAYVFACKSCADEKDRFIAYLHSYEASVKADVASVYAASAAKHEEVPLAAQNDFMSREGSMVKRVEDADWTPAGSPEGTRIREEYRDKCDSSESGPIPCNP